MSFIGKIALISGASQGIGKAIAMQLGKLGATIIGTDYSPELATQISEYLQVAGLKGCGFVLDVTKQESIDAAMSQIISAYGVPTILVNNAGITRDNLLLRMSMDDWERVIDTNMTSVFRLCKVCIRDMIKARWGRIINIASVVGYTGNAGQANYTSAKAGMVAFSKSLALEVASRGITVNNIAPGFIETNMTKKLTEPQRQAIMQSVPMARMGQPEDIAKTVAFLVSDAADYITGQTIHVNGGMFML